MNERKFYLDNLRWMTVVLVIIFHIIYIYNCSGVASSIGVHGIPILDSFLVFVYPWFMCLLFVVAGISSRYSLKKRTNKEFIKDRAKRILVPSIVGIFVYGWISGLILNQYTDIFAGNGDMIPGFIKYIIYSLISIGPLWFCHVLFIACVLLVLIRKIDKEDKLSKFFSKIHPLMLIPLTLLVWGSSFVLNTPIVTVYKFGIYLLMFFFGYYIFSNEDFLEKISKFSIPLLVVSFVVGIIYTIVFYGQNYSSDEVLQNIFTNTYLWLMVISLLAFSKKYLNFSNKFTKYMTKNNFNFYVLHYTIVVVLGYLVVTYLNLPFALNYILVLIGTIVILPLLVEIIKRIPIVRKLILGISK